MSGLTGHVLDDLAVRARSLELAREATADGEGAQHGEPFYELVTEGRQTSNRYSSCADLAHYVLWHLAEQEWEVIQHTIPSLYQAWRTEALRTVNRDEAGGWVPGVNVSKLCGSPAFVHHARAGSFDARPGDIVVIGENGAEHVLVVEEPPVTLPGTVTSLDYGQVFARPGQPLNYGGCRRERACTRGADGRLYLGSGAAGTIAGPRAVLGFVDVADWLARVIAAG